MRDKPYFSIRTGRRREDPKLSLDPLRRSFVALHSEFTEKGYFQEHLGIGCVDGFIPGLAGLDVALYVLRKLRKEDLWPVWEHAEHYTADDIFDLLEFLYDHASKPTDEGHYHSWNGCGHHYSRFDGESGRSAFRAEVNQVLRLYDDGFELSVEGEILTLPGGEIEPLLESELPSPDHENVTARVHAAAQKFRRRGSSESDRRDAIRDLADVLEYLRPEAKKVLSSQDEADLFNIANNFGIRHHNKQQKTHYNKSVWLSWMFYYYLASIHALVRLINEHRS